jgi:hypothetical protein
MHGDSVLQFRQENAWKRQKHRVKKYHNSSDEQSWTRRRNLHYSGKLVDLYTETV